MDMEEFLEDVMPPPLTSPEELNELMIFVGNKVKDVKTSNDARQHKITGLARQFIEEIGCPRSQSLISERIKSQAHRIHEMKEFDKSTKVKMLVILAAPVDAEFLIEIRKDANVEIDRQGRIVKYKANDGSLELDIDEILTAPQKVKRMSKKEAVKALKGSTKSGQSSTSTSASANRGSGGNRTSGVASGNKKRKDSASRNVPTTSTGRKRPRISDSEDQNEEELADSGVGDPIDYPQNHAEDEEVIVVDTIPVEQKPLVENSQDNYPNNEEQDDDMMVLQPAPVDQKPQGLLQISGPIRGEPTTSVKELLILLRGPVLAIKSSSLSGICAKFDAKIQELANGNQQMLVENLQIPLDACLFLLLKHAALKCPPEVEATSLRDFLLRLQATTCPIIHPSMASFHQKLKTKIFELSARDERIPINVIDRAMDNTLYMLDA